MTKIKYFLQLIRFPNLIIIAATQYLMRWSVVYPILEINDFSHQFSSLNFALLVLATISITAGGYVINDYFDNKTDLVNRPKRVIVGKHISRRVTMSWHIVLNFIGIILGIYIAYKINLLEAGLIFPLVAGLLWYYSTTYKNILILGNIIVSLLVGLIPLMVAIFEIPPLNMAYLETLARHNDNFFNIFIWVGGFSYFAFLTTLIREIIKDTEDFEGDSAYGRNTLPVATGIPFTKAVIVFLIIVTIISLFLIYYTFTDFTITLWYFLIVLILPLAYAAIKTIKAETKADYHILSTLMKVIMLGGILYAPVSFLILRFKFF